MAYNDPKNTIDTLARISEMNKPHLSPLKLMVWLSDLRTHYAPWQGRVCFINDDQSDDN